MKQINNYINWEWNNTPIRNCQTGKDRKNQLYIVYKKFTLNSKTIRLKIKGWGRKHHANYKHKKGEVAISILDNTDLKITNIIRIKEVYFKIVKGDLQEDITIINVSLPNHRCPKYTNQNSQK